MHTGTVSKVPSALQSRLSEDVDGASLSGGRRCWGQVAAAPCVQFPAVPCQEAQEKRCGWTAAEELQW